MKCRLRSVPLVVGGCLSLGLLAGCQDPGPESWREDRGRIHVVHLYGSPYEMGRAHGRLFREEIAAVGEWMESEFLLWVMEDTAELIGVLDEAETASYPEIVEECQGIVDAVDSPHFPLTRCLLFAYGDVVAETIYHEMPGCTQVVVAPPASTGGLIHGRVLDWLDVPHVVEHPTLFVRHPDEGLASVAFGFPAQVSPFSGINEAGLALASNEAHGVEPPDRDGIPHTQMVYRLLRDASSVGEVRSFFEAANHASTETVVASDASGEAAAFEMACDGMAERPLSPEGTLYAVNHFVHPDTVPFHKVPPQGDSSPPRWARLQQLVEPDGTDTMHGSFGLDEVVSVLRDTHNPETGETHPPSLVDGGGTIANNGALQAIVFAPEQGAIWVADGPAPVPQNPFVGFDVRALIDGHVDAAPDPPLIE